MKKSAAVTPRVTLQRSLLSMAVAAATFGMAPAHAFQFEFMDGEVQGSFDTTMSYGALWRVTGQNSENVAIQKGGERNSANFDNGNVNYDRGDLVSSLFKVTHDVSLSYKNVGAFGRVLYFYDHAIQNKDFNGTNSNTPPIGDQRVIRNRLGHDYEIFDAYIRGDFKVADKNLNARLGKQVVSWGESTFIPNGLNVINPVDVAKLRAPGSELKEAFLPVNMLWLSQELTDNVTVEVFNQFAFKKTRIEPNGSYFSTNDFASPGGDRVLIGGGVDREDNPTFIPRSEDRDANRNHQYGVAFRMLAPNLNNTEFGIYAMNLHSRTPLISGTTTSSNQATEDAIVAAVIGGGGTPQQAAGAVTLNRAANSRYFNEFPEDIQIYGLSFSTLGPLGIALQGEYSYRPNQPLQLAANNLLAELLSLGAAPINTGIGPQDRNTDVEGFKRVRVHQVQMTGTQTFGPRLGATQVVGVAEAGYVYQHLPNGIDFNGNGVDFTTNVNNQGIMTKESYGYRAVVRADYTNVIAAINLSPRIAFSHDLRGTSQTFNQKAQAVTLGVGASYQSNWTADLAYTNFFAGEKFEGVRPDGIRTRSSNNPLSDRDFIAATVSYAF